MERTTFTRTLVRIIFASSFASLGYELALMRIFSITLWYHFAFMVISIAMLGIGASGSILFMLPGLKDARRLPLYALLLALSIPASCLLANAVPFDPVRLSWDRLQLLAVGLYYIILCVPFVCFGLIVSTAYATLPELANAVYASDLIGAGAGALAMAWLLSLNGPAAVVLMLSLLLATALFSSSITPVLRIASFLLIVLNAAVLRVDPAFLEPGISPYKPFMLAMQFPGAEHLGTAYSPSARLDLFRSPAVRFAPGLSFTYREPLPPQIGMAIDAGDIYALTDETDRGSLAFVRFLPSSLAYRMGALDDVLIIEPRGGLALLTAREFRAARVTAIDSNPLALQAMQEYRRTQERGPDASLALAGLARTWLAASGRTFDLIDISLMGSRPSAAFGFAEDYRFTVEAFERYLAGLNSGGIISLNLYIMPPPRTELRLVATLSRAAASRGIADISRHVAAIRSWDTLTVLVKRSPMTGEDIHRIRAFAQRMRFDLVYYPGITPEEGNVHIKQPTDAYARAFRSLVQNHSRDRFIDDYLFDVRPATDDRPFFHYYLKLANLGSIYRVMGEKWNFFIEEGYLLPVLFAQVLIASMVLLVLPLRRSRKGGSGDKDNPLTALSYFALLGISFLFVEIACLQKMVLCLENPATAAGMVIAAILISSGMGSLVSRRVRPLRSPRVLPVLAALVALEGPVLDAAMDGLGRYPLMARTTASFLLVMPMGALMGIPFPLGISRIGSTAPRLVPWAWAVNGCFSVLAPILAVMLALSAGYQVVLFCGAGSYLAAYWLLQRMEH